MKTIVLFYSYTGTSKKVAKGKALEEFADIYQVKEIKKRGKIDASILGCIAARMRKSSDILKIQVNLTNYDRIIVVGPIWAGYYAPAVNSIIDAIPTGKKVSFIAVSGNGKSGSKEHAYARIVAKGCQMESYVDFNA